MPEHHLMFLHAHPDDESSKGAATMAKYVQAGHRVTVVTFTDGGQGEILNPALEGQPDVIEHLIEVRQKEIAAALAALGVTEHVDLAYPDSGWVEGFTGDGTTPSDQLDPACFYNVSDDVVAADLVPVLRETRPDVVVTYDPAGGYPHPDHIRTHTATMAALNAAADPTYRPELGEPYKPWKLYYHKSFNPVRLQAMAAIADREGIVHPFDEWIERRLEFEDPWPITTSVEIGDQIPLRSAALRAHATQIDPNGFWFLLSDDLAREAHPYEDYHLVSSTQPVNIPEDDLLASLK